MILFHFIILNKKCVRKGREGMGEKCSYINYNLELDFELVESVNVNIKSLIGSFTT